MTITEAQVSAITMAKTLGTSKAKVSRLLGLDRHTVAKYWANPTIRPRQREPSAKLKSRRKALHSLAKKVTTKGNRSWPTFGSASQLRSALFNSTGTLLSVRQIQRDLHSVGLKPYVRPSAPTRTKVDLSKKTAFAKRMRSLPPKARRRMVFSDECWVSCVERTGRIHWTTSKSAALPLERKARWNVPSAMIWASVGIGWKGPIVILPSKRKDADGEDKVFRLDSRDYVRKCLSTVAGKLKSQGRLFQQDGARSHVAKGTLAYLRRKGIDFVADWPPYSPEWNAIERVWAILLDRVGRRCPMTSDELVRVVREEWQAIPQSVIDKQCGHFCRQMMEYGKKH